MVKPILTAPSKAAETSLTTASGAHLAVTSLKALGAFATSQYFCWFSGRNRKFMNSIHASLCSVVAEIEYPESSALNTTGDEPCIYAGYGANPILSSISGEASSTLEIAHMPLLNIAVLPLTKSCTQLSLVAVRISSLISPLSCNSFILPAKTAIGPSLSANFNAS